MGSASVGGMSHGFAGEPQKFKKGPWSSRNRQGRDDFSCEKGRSENGDPSSNLRFRITDRRDGILHAGWCLVGAADFNAYGSCRPPVRSPFGKPFGRIWEPGLVSFWSPFWCLFGALFGACFGAANGCVLRCGLRSGGVGGWVVRAAPYTAEAV